MTHDPKSWLVHISHEAVRPLGGVGIQIRNLIKTQSLRGKFGNNIVLAGPLFFPEEGDCRTLTNLETLKELKRNLPLYNRIYPPTSAEGCKKLIDRFRNIEHYFNVHIYYYKDVSRENYNTGILLVDHSSVFGQSYMQSRFFNEIVSKINFETHSNLYDLNVHPHQMKLGERVHNELIQHFSQKDISEELCEEMKTPIAKLPGYIDYNYILGLLIAEPLSRAIVALCDSNDDVYAIANDYFGLPTLYQIEKEREKVKTVLYVSEVSPARHLVEQQLPKISNNETFNNTNHDQHLEENSIITIGDSRFYNIMKSAKDIGMEKIFNKLGELYKDKADFYNEKVVAGDPKRGDYTESAKKCIDASKAVDISDHSSSRIFHLAKYVDAIIANGENSKEEFVWLLNSSFKDKRDNIQIIPHGLDFDNKTNGHTNSKDDAKRKILKRLKQTFGTFVYKGKKTEEKFHFSLDSHYYLFLKISRPIPCKAFDRDIKVCKKIDDFLDTEKKKTLFLVVSNWDTKQTRNPINEWIELAISSNFKNISFFFINQFDWPNNPEDTNNSLKREVLLQASDVSFSQSRYESFGIAQIEPLQYGTICLVSSASGAYSLLKKNEILLDKIKSPIIVADYIGYDDSKSSQASTREEIDDLPLQVFQRDWEDNEDKIAESIAKEINEKLKADKEILYKEGCDIVKKHFNWDDIAKKFISVIEKIPN